METTTHTGNGQLVIPKPACDALHLESGASFSVTTDGEHIMLEPTTLKRQRLADWLPALRWRRRIPTNAFGLPVADTRVNDRDRYRWSRATAMLRIGDCEIVAVPKPDDAIRGITP